MFKIFKADADAYITDRVIAGSRVHAANVGQASTLDLFKLYGVSSSGTIPNLEISRLLVHFDLTPLTALVSTGKIDPSHHSFFARLQLTDVYGGQTTPDNFDIVVCPLSKSFEEGHGRDVVYYSDRDLVNFLTAAANDPWLGTGCTQSGTVSSNCDYYIDNSVCVTQHFKTGEEDLDVDVTGAIRATLSGTIPSAGFRISFSNGIETDAYSYFVKRFAARHAYDDEKHPRLVIGFDDSIRDSSQGMTTNSNETLFLYNYDHALPANLTSGSNQVTGSNCLLLSLVLPISGGSFVMNFTGSQHYAGVNPVVGVYSASVYVPGDNINITNAMTASGNIIRLTPIWGSLDGTIAYTTGSSVEVTPGLRGSTNLTPRKFVVSSYGLNSTHRSTDVAIVRVNMFDYTLPTIKVVKIPTNSPGTLQGYASDAFYRIRNAVTQKIVIPFDTVNGSTRLSGDSESLFFKLDMSNLSPEKTYVVDVLLIVGGEQQYYDSVSQVFKVSDLQ